MISIIYLIIILSLIIEISPFNLDTKYPVVYVDPQNGLGNQSSYFGYSVVLYPAQNTGYPWLVIGAPRGFNPRYRSFNQPGIVYFCFFKSTCSVLNIDAIPGEVRFAEIILDHAWLGGNVDIDVASNRLVVCAPKWTANFDSGDYLAFGTCFWATTDDPENMNLLSPLFTTNPNLIISYDSRPYVYFYGQGLGGFSSELTNDSKLILGAPGIYNWAGSTAMYQDHFPQQTSPVNARPFTYKNVASAPYTGQINVFDLTGYSVTSGFFFDRQRRIYVTSAPRAKHLAGHVMLYYFDDETERPMNVREIKQGTQMGEYFGASLAAGDVNSDGHDDLIIGAPFHKSREYNEGRIYVYLGSSRGSLEVPNIGSTIDGSHSNALFGLTVQYLNDLDQDGYGDIAVAAPNEMDGTGVVYIFKGSKTGLRLKSSQRIEGKSFVPTIRGFGCGISKPVDIDMNGYRDIAIGAYKSGHVVLLRGSVVAVVRHSLRSSQKFLNATTDSFVINTCVSVGAEPRISNKMRIRRIVTVDEEFDRTEIKREDAEKELILGENEMFCEDVTVSLKKSLKNLYNPVIVSLSHEFVQQDSPGSVILIGETMEGSDDFCVRCPVYDRYRSSKTSNISIPFTLGCYEDNICQSNLDLEMKILNLREDNVFILGSEDYLFLDTRVTNTGENAYLSELSISLPDQVYFRQYPPNCLQGSPTLLSCSLGNPILANTFKNVLVELDMKDVNSGRYGDSLVIQVQVSTSSLNVNEDNAKNFTVFLTREADITISGKSGELTYFYGNISNETSKFEQIYEVNKIGDSPIEKVTIEIQIPQFIRTPSGRSDIIGLYPPEGYLGGQPIKCYSNFEYVHKEASAGTGNPGVDFEVDGEQLYNRKLLRRSVDEVLRRSVDEVPSGSIDEVDVFADNSTTGNRSDRLSEEGASYKLLENSTFYINCSQETVICSSLVCSSGPFKKDQTSAVIRLRMHLDIEPFKDLLNIGDAIVLSTHGSVEIKNPPGFIQSGDRPDSAIVRTLFISNKNKVTKPIALWIIAVSVIAGLLLLLLIIAGLIKAGFFRRGKKKELEDLQNLQNQADEGKSENGKLDDECFSNIENHDSLLDGENK